MWVAFVPDKVLRQAGYRRVGEFWTRSRGGRDVQVEAQTHTVCVRTTLRAPALGPPAIVDGVEIRASDEGVVELSSPWGVMDAEDVLSRLERGVTRGADLLEQPVAWAQLQAHGLIRVGAALEGVVGQARVRVAWVGGWIVEAACPPHVRVQAGRGHSGNPVLDSLVDSANVPECAVGEALALVREHDGHALDGRVRVVGTPQPVQAFGAVVRLANALQGAETPALPVPQVEGPGAAWIAEREDELAKWSLWTWPLLALSVVMTVGLVWTLLAEPGLAAMAVPYVVGPAWLGLSGLRRRRGHGPLAWWVALLGPLGIPFVLARRRECPYCHAPAVDQACRGCGYEGP